jgi:Fe-S oxidoreductase
MLEQVVAQGERVVALFAACAARPDDPAVARAAEKALEVLEDLLVRCARTPPMNGTGG